MNRLMTNGKTKKDVMVDLVQVGTMLVVSNVLSSQVNKTPMFDKAWTQSSMHTLIGFVVYDVVVQKLVQLPIANPDLAAAAKYWLKFGTMFVVSRLLSGQPLNDQKWMMATLYSLVGFTVFALGTRKFMPQVADPVMQGVVFDWFEVGTMLVVSQLLAGKPLDQAWMQESLFTLLGFNAYRVATHRLVPQ